MTRRLALVSNCLLNQNAKVDEYALCPGAVPGVLDALLAAGFELIQMPCPEMAFLGARRWWQVREQYDTPGYRRRCRELAGAVADILAARLGEGPVDLVLIGVDGSPSSGVSVTDSGAGWGGRPGDAPFAFVPGKGVWIEELEAVLAARGLPAPRAFGVGMELPGYDAAEATEALVRFLDGGADARR
jgi:predicted secreted protein